MKCVLCAKKSAELRERKGFIGILLRKNLNEVDDTGQQFRLPALYLSRLSIDDLIAIDYIGTIYFYRRMAVMAVTLSANVEKQMALKVRIVAEKEHRSISNVISSALTVFTGLPKDVRDTLLELQSHQDVNGIKRLSREMMAAVSRIRLETATERLTAEKIFGGADSGADEIDLMEEATRLSEAARRAKQNP